MKLRVPFFTIIILAGTFLGGVFFYKSCLKHKEKVAQIDTTLVIERIEKVMKLVSVEGHYTELLKYDKSTFDFPGFRKKALVQVNGRVLVGYDMEKFSMNYDIDKKVLNIQQLPAPEILAIETSTKYFDMEQGIFNSFTKDELTLIDKKSKEVIRNKALADQLIQAAEEQKNELLMMVLEPLMLSGWKITVNGKELQNPSVTLNKN